MRQPLVRTVALVAAAVVAAGLAAGCTSKDEEGGGKESSQSSDSPTLGAWEVDLTKTVGQVEEFEIPGQPGDTVEIGVLSLKVYDKVQVLNLVLTPHFASRSRDSSVWLWEMVDGPGFFPQLIDRENLKIYSAVDASNASALYSIKTGNDQPLYVYAVFASPEDDNMEFGLQIIDNWPPIAVKAER